MVTFEEYKAHYEKWDKCIGDSFRNKNKFNDNQLRTKYKKFMSKYNEQGETKDQAIRRQVVARDVNCRLMGKLTLEEVRELEPNHLYNTLDVAHIFPKSVYPHMRYNLDNVILLNRVFHNRLDQGLNPMTGQKIDKEWTEDWWKLAVGDEKYEALKEIAKNGKKKKR